MRGSPTIPTVEISLRTSPRRPLTTQSRVEVTGDWRLSRGTIKAWLPRKSPKKIALVKIFMLMIETKVYSFEKKQPVYFV